MRRKNKSRKARRTGTPVGEEELYSDCDVTEEVYEVECIVDHRCRRGGTEYKVRWRGWSPQFDEWLHYSKMDCPEAIKEYWEQVEARKSKEPGSSKKRDHSDTHSVKSNSSRRSTSPPEAKRRLFDNTDLQGGSQDSGSVSPTISECLGRASPKQYGQGETLEDRQSVEKGATNSKSASVEPNERVDSVAQEGVELDAQPQPAQGVTTTSLQKEIPSTDVSARSSPCPSLQQSVRKSVSHSKL
ncbi:unnamed protein product [Haemonchus placei]|uniref:Chromo domain-containing protein n=1 Tax=Haemonchus placei TaxID=6290 RepID=A0A158QRS7_HAEPC|nr:unnamed protein product [Haemonchus placei]